MISFWRFIKYYFLGSLKKQRIPNDIAKRLRIDFRFNGKIISTDMYNLKGIKITRSGVVGIPDLLAFVRVEGKRHCLVGERKGRKYNHNVRKHEIYQVLLYMYIIRSYQPYPVIGRISYNDHHIDVTFDMDLVKHILTYRKECIQTLKHLL